MRVTTDSTTLGVIFREVMRRRPSFLLRASRAMVGLVTVWCLGCSGYEPLLDGLLGATPSSMMRCASDMDTGAAVDAAPSTVTEQSHDAHASVSVPANDQGFDCGCGGSCHAPSPTPSVTPAPRIPVTAVVQAQPSAPPSVFRAPLLPPPEFAVR
jgi:hypothetical protein